MSEFDPSSVACDLYDRLEELSVLKKECRFYYRKNNQDQEAQGVIVDLYVSEGIEWLRLNNGLEIILSNLLKTPEPIS